MTLTYFFLEKDVNIELCIYSGNVKEIKIAWSNII